MPQYRLLFVDDEPQFRNALEEWFLSHGYEVAGAADGVEALEKCAESHFDLITLDLEMPRMNGLETARVLHERFPDVPVVVLTASPSHAASLEEVGVADILLKPISLHVLLSRIESLLGSEQNS